MGAEEIAKKIGSTLRLSFTIVLKILELFEEGATIPFIARYRKDQTGGLDEVQLLQILNIHKQIKDLESRKESILKSIKEQGKLDAELERRIRECENLTLLEDLYLPYKLKRKTRAEKARKLGLEPLAKIIMSQRYPLIDQKAEEFVQGEISSLDEALQGARDIIAEWVNESSASRNLVRRKFSRDAMLVAKVVKKHKEKAIKYKDYFEFEQALRKCPSHRILAIFRAEKEGFLRVSINIDENDLIDGLSRIFIKENNESSDQVLLAIKDSYKRLLHPSIETEFRNAAKEKADKEAIDVFASNVEQLLLASPAGSKITLGIDPGFRTGCKIVVLNEEGSLLHHTTIFPHPPQSKYQESKLKIESLIEKYKVQLIGVGNGTAGRETLQLAKEAAKIYKELEVFSVNESGASIYSASEIAREEFGDLDITVRGTVSIARRLMDPMAELVKIDPKSIGVGQYQHDVNQDQLKSSLDNVVSFAVNKVGVNLNTASYKLLSYVSGIGPKLARNIVDFRTQEKRFKSRNQLKEVKGLGKKAFEQSAGFLRVKGSQDPLDDTAVHPESYKVVRKISRHLGVSIYDLIGSEERIKQIKVKDYLDETIGEIGLRDILKELAKPGIDPRGKAEKFEFSEQVKSISDLSPGIVLPGIISNLTKFGAFVDIGIKENGLIHISQIVDRFISDPAEVLKVDQKVKVELVSLDLDRKRIALKMKGVKQ